MDSTVSGYRHKVAFFKTPGDLWMLKGTSPNVCMTIAPNYRLQNEIPTVESSGNVITRRFVGPLLRRYCDRTKTTGVAAKPTAAARRLVCEGRAIGYAPNGRPADDVISGKADAANDVRGADDLRYNADGYYRRPDDFRGQFTSTGGYRRVGGLRCGSEGRIPWHVGRVYTGDSLVSVADRSGMIAAKEGTQSLVALSLLRNKQNIAAGGRIVQPPKFHFPVLHGIKSRAFASGEKKHVCQAEHEPEMKVEETGSDSKAKLKLQNSLVVCKLLPLKSWSGPTVAKPSYLIKRRGTNNTPENGAGRSTLKVNPGCRATDEEEISGIQGSSGQSITLHEKYNGASVASERDATVFQKDHFMRKNMISASHDHVDQAKDR